MNLRDYQIAAGTTAVYPDTAYVTYPALGLCNEIGEYLESDTDSMWGELGDIMWYVSALATDLEADLQDCFDLTEPGGMHSVTVLVIHAARIAGWVKKIIRGDGNDKRDDILKSIGEIIHTIDVISRSRGKSVDQVCQENIDKLFDRKDRGVLKGDGDNR